jgi:hypothetical protein
LAPAIKTAETREGIMRAMSLRHFCNGLLAAAGLAVLVAPSVPARADVAHASLAVPGTVVLFLFEYVAEDQHINDGIFTAEFVK